MILLLNDKNGCRYENARKENFFFLQIKWIHDSLKAGYLMPFEQYKMEYLDKQTTEENNKAQSKITSIQTDVSNENSQNSNNNEEMLLSEDDTIIYDFDNDSLKEIDLDTNLLLDLSNKSSLMFEGFNFENWNTIVENTRKTLQIPIKDNTENGTHLILRNPIGSEKVLSAIAYGSWILKPDYFSDSIKLAKLLPENKYQWGWEFVDKLDRINSVSEKLMVSALRWKCYLDKNQKKLFEDIQFLFLTADTTMMNCCKNILSAGGATLYFIDDLKNNPNSTILPFIDYALIDTELVQKPNVSMEFISYCIEHFQSKNTLISFQNIVQFILDGPSENVSVIKSLKNKYLINIKTIKKSITNIYNKKL